MSRLWLFGGDDVYVKGKRRLLSGSEIAAILKTALVKNGQEMSQDPKARKEPRKLEIKNKGIHNSLAEWTVALLEPCFIQHMKQAQTSLYDDFFERWKEGSSDEKEKRGEKYSSRRGTLSCRCPS
jgi:hypothetical protein